MRQPVAPSARGVDVFPRGDGEHLAAHEPREGRHVDDPERDDHAGEPGAQDRAEGESEHERGKRQHRVHAPHDEPVGAAARVAGGETQHTARGHRDGHRHEARHQRDARAPHHAGEHVATDIVGAQQVGAAEILLEGIVRRDRRREDRHRERPQRGRIRGRSSHRRSTARLLRMKPTAISSTTPWTSG